AKAKVWPKRTPEEEAEKKKRQRAKRAEKWPEVAERWAAMIPELKGGGARKGGGGQGGGGRGWWRRPAVVELRALHTMAARQARLATLREGTRGGRRWEVARRRIADGRWNMEGPLAPDDEEVEQNWFWRRHRRPDGGGWR
ncbi:unnamed protein product, partial [Symbiodinium microadriaticum]